MHVVEFRSPTVFCNFSGQRVYNKESIDRARIGFTNYGIIVASPYERNVNQGDAMK